MQTEKQRGKLSLSQSRLESVYRKLSILKASNCSIFILQYHDLANDTNTGM